MLEGVAPMTERDYDHEEDIVGDGIDDSVVTDPDAVSVPTSERTRGRGPRVFR